jgi:hypothetical protein
VQTIDDTIDEDDETFDVVITNQVNVIIVKGTGRGEIIDR